MIILYRSPSVIIDAHEWRLSVFESKSGHPSIHYCWRPLSARPGRWQPIVAWQGRKPNGIKQSFWRFRAHVREAITSTQRRREALTGVKRTLLGTPIRQRGCRDPHHHGLGLVTL